MAAKIAIFVPAHCLSHDEPSRLSEMARVATEKGAELMVKLDAECIVLSCAYDTWQTDAALKHVIVKRYGIDDDSIQVVGGVTSTYDEAEKIRAIINGLGITVVVIVTDEWHALRAAPALEERYPGVTILLETFVTPKFEQMLEPSRIKRIRVGNKWLWIAWNIFFRLRPPH